jgi:hypothetical protein
MAELPEHAFEPAYLYLIYSLAQPTMEQAIRLGSILANTSVKRYL